MIWKLLVLSLALALMPSCASAQQPAPPAAPSEAAPRIAVTKHSGKFNAVDVRYTATVREHFLRDEQGAAVATATTIAYVRDGVRDTSQRPVLFLFNGGPGASSSPLHMSAMGPKQRVGGSNSTEAKWVINPYSPIDFADLVFIDPPGTGFSRALPGKDARRFYAVDSDALAAETVVQEWLKVNGREASPRFLVGESYGTIRAAVMAKSSRLKWNGVLLVAVAPDVSGREMPFVASLPTMAAGAWHHNRIDRAGKTVEQHYDEALNFARTDYVAALIRGASLPAADKRRIAERMSKLVGLPGDLIEQENLRLSKNAWMFNLLKAPDGLRTGLLDVRVTARLEPGALGDLDDPALGVVPPRGANEPAGAAPPTPQSVGEVESPAVAAYLKQELKYLTAEPYYGVNFIVNSQWNREGGGRAFEGLAAAMKADPGLRLYWSGGLYDLTTPAYAAAYTFDQLGMPADRVMGALFAGPHGVYEGEENLARFNRSVRDFILKK
jgi:carboxypeptidase C (cathepsin A)